MACCDVVGAKAEAMAKENGAVAFTDAAEMLRSMKGKMDVVAICSPNGLHAKHSIAALNAGFHVLCEKPMAISVYDCGEMIKTAERVNRRLFAIKQNRFNPPVEAVKKAIDEGVSASSIVFSSPASGTESRSIMRTVGRERWTWTVARCSPSSAISSTCSIG